MSTFWDVARQAAAAQGAAPGGIYDPAGPYMTSPIRWTKAGSPEIDQMNRERSITQSMGIGTKPFAYRPFSRFGGGTNPAMMTQGIPPMRSAAPPQMPQLPPAPNIPMGKGSAGMSNQLLPLLMMTGGGTPMGKGTPRR